MLHFQMFSGLSDFTDEVESLTAARAGAMSGTEPSDALRVSLYESRTIVLYI